MKIGRLLKWLGIAVFSVLVLVACVAAFLFSRVDFESLRPRVMEMATAALETSVSIGRIQGHVFPRPSLSLDDVQVGDEGQEILRLKGLSVDFKLLPLLHGQPELHQISGWNGQAVLDIAPDGRILWGEIGKKSDTEKEEMGSASLLTSLESLSLKDVSVRVRQAGEADVVLKLDQLAGHLGRNMRLLASGKLSEQPLRIDMVSGKPEDFFDGKKPWDLDLSAVLGDLTINMQGNMPALLRLQRPWQNNFSMMVDVHGDIPAFVYPVIGIPDLGQIKLSGRVSAQKGKLDLSGLKLNVMGNALTGKIGLAPDEKPVHFSGRLDITKLDLQSLQGFWKDPAKGETKPAASLENRVQEMAEKLAKLDADFSLTAKHVELLSGHVVQNLTSALRIEEGRVALSPFAFDFAGRSFVGTLHADMGQKAWPVSLKLSQGQHDLDMSGSLIYGENLWRMSKVKAKLGPSDVSGDMALNLAASPATVSVDMVGSMLDLDDVSLLFADKENHEAETDAETASKSLMPSGALPRLPDLAGNMSVKFDQVMLKNIPLQAVVLKASLKPSLAKISEFGFVVVDTPVALSGQYGFQNDQGQVSVSGKAKNLDYGQIFKQANVTDLVDGHADVAFDMSATGTDWNALRQNLKGTARFVGGAGKIANGQLDLWASDLVMAMLPKATEEAKNMTKVNCTVALWNVTDGKADLSNFLFDTGKITVRGSGGVNLVDETLDMRFVPEPKNVSLMSMAPPVRVSGSLLAPKVDVEKGTSLLKGAVATGAVLGMVNPVGALATLVKKGTGDSNPCDAYLEKENP